MSGFSGLTWDHPRGYDALAAAAKQADAAGQLSLTWQKQPLEGFEAHPIAELCAEYDLVVLDHPHIGEAVRHECLQPLDTVFEPAALAAIAARTIGRSFDSYYYGARQWALPLDAATQVMAFRPDLVGDEAPTSWDAVARLARSVPVTLSTAGPHAALALMSIALAGGTTPAVEGRFLPTEAGLAALDIMAQIHAHAPRATRTLNPIGILGAMAATDDVALCPLIYGYVNYAAPTTAGHRRVGFADVPRRTDNGPLGSILGGTGIGITRRCRVTPALVEHLLWLLSEAAQTDFIPTNAGQPSARPAWHSDAVNAQWNGFYRNTAATLEAAHVRPRFDGYIAFQTRASALVRDGLEQGRPHLDILNDLETAYGISAARDHER